jgi:transposase
MRRCRSGTPVIRPATAAPSASTKRSAQIGNHYLGALARGDTDSRDEDTTLAQKARTLINRFRQVVDMILRFATNLSVPFTNNEAEVRHEVACSEWTRRKEGRLMVWSAA